MTECREPDLQAVSDSWIVGRDVANVFLLEREDYPQWLPSAPAVDPVWQEPEATDYDFEMTLEEVGEALGGLSRERVRQIETKAFRKLRHPKRSNGLKEFIR